MTYISFHPGPCDHMYRYHHCTDAMTRHTSSPYSCAPLHRIPSCHIIVIIVTWILGILLLHMHVWFLYSCHMDSRSYYVIRIPIHITCIIVPCYRIHVIWLFLVTDMDIPDIGYESCWYAICGIPHLLFPFPVILFPFPVILLCYQQSSGPVIRLTVSCIVFVLVIFRS